MTILQACCGPQPPSIDPPIFPFADSFPPSGHTFYRDDYRTLYEVTWETVSFGGDFLIDFTVITKQPYVWNEIDQGSIQNKIVYRRGICTTWRFIIGPHEDGYEIVAEGTSQVICTYQDTFNCEQNPADEFAHHLDSYVCDEVENIVTCGPRFTDPEDPGEAPVIFQVVTAGGNVVLTPNTQPFQFVNVWGQDDNLTAVCTVDVTGTDGDDICVGIGDGDGGVIGDGDGGCIGLGD